MLYCAWYWYSLQTLDYHRSIFILLLKYIDRNLKFDVLGCFEGRQKSPSSRVDEAVVK
jgi:hypothetical protein